MNKKEIFKSELNKKTSKTQKYFVKNSSGKSVSIEYANNEYEAKNKWAMRYGRTSNEATAVCIEGGKIPQIKVEEVK